jgi:3-polyprenyl-4-hydroxybenzoate decarboxylase
MKIYTLFNPTISSSHRVKQIDNRTYASTPIPHEHIYRNMQLAEEKKSKEAAYLDGDLRA